MIESVYWQPRIGHLGEIVEDIADINQCINTIIWTQQGSDPHRPDFGIGIQEYVDKPLNYVRPRLVREILQQCARWESRARITAVLVDSASSSSGQISISVRWVPTGASNSPGSSVENTTAVTAPAPAVPQSAVIPYSYATVDEIDGGAV